MITNGTLIILLPETPSALCAAHDDLSKVRHDGTLRQYFGMISQTTSEATALNQARSSSIRDTFVIIEKGFFVNESARKISKESLEELGIPSNHILFGEDYASGRHHILLAVRSLCES